MADRADQNHVTDWQQGALDLGPSPTAPPRTRGECADIPRPCMRTTCPHNLLRDDEPEGRPGDGKHREDPEIRLRRQFKSSCALDVADQGQHTVQQIAEELGVCDVRERQYEQRGGSKFNLGMKFLEHMERFRRDEMPEGAELTVEGHRPPTGVATHTQTFIVAFTYEERAVTSTSKRLGVTVRRRKDEK